MNVDDQPDRQPDADLTDAWVYAANCRLYENDPGPAELNIASRIEPMWVSRAEAFRDLYARLLLEELDADAARIAVLAGQITAETKQKPPPEVAEVWDICRRAVSAGRRDHRRGGGSHRCPCAPQTACRNHTSHTLSGTGPVGACLPGGARQRATPSAQRH